jgi:hypothetical protein
MGERDRLKELQTLLHDMGSTHSLEDIRAMIEMGEMQSFGVGESWAVTTVVPFPQATVVDIFFIVGELKDFEELQRKIEAFARHIGATFMRVYGRPGFEYLIDRRNWPPGQGWRKGPRVYTRRLDLH